VNDSATESLNASGADSISNAAVAGTPVAAGEGLVVGLGTAVADSTVSAIIATVASGCLVETGAVSVGITSVWQAAKNKIKKKNTKLTRLIKSPE
jgi:hypothetical protein